MKFYVDAQLHSIRNMTRIGWFDLICVCFVYSIDDLKFELHAARSEHLMDRHALLLNR